MGTGKLVQVARRSAIVLTAVLAAALAPAAAGARTFVVDDVADSHDAAPGNGVCKGGAEGRCSLRAAIEEANAWPGADTIRLGAKRFLLGYGELTITSDLTITGAGAAATIIDCQNWSRAFVVNAPGATVSLQRLTIYRGTANQGGAIYNQASALTRLASCSLLANRAQEGGAIYNNYGSTLAIGSCLIADNTAVATSGSNAFGGAIFNSFVARVSDSKIVANGAMASGAGGYAYGGGVYSGFSEEATFSATRTVFSGNNVLSHNESAKGGAGAMQAGLAIFTDCRVSGNATYAPSAEGRAHGGGLYFDSTVGTVNSTAVTGNFASGGAPGGGGFGAGGGILVVGAGQKVTIRRGSVIRSNRTSGFQGGVGEAYAGLLVISPDTVITGNLPTNRD